VGWGKFHEYCLAILFNILIDAEMSLFARLCSSSSLVGKNPLLSLGFNIHTKSPLKNISLSKHLHSSAILSLYKDTKPGRVRKHAESVNKKVAMMRRIGERMMIADKVPPDYELVYRLKLDEYLVPMKWGSFLGGCALLIFLPLNIYVGRSGSMHGMGLMESDPWEFMVLFAILGAHCIAGQWLCMAVPPRIYYNERKDDFIMITNSFLPWRSDHLSLTEGSIVHAPTKSDVMNVNSWKHLLVTSRPKKLFIGRDHFQSEWFYRKLLGTHFEAGHSVPPWRRY